MNLNSICHPSPTKKMKCSFLDYVQLLMIGRAGQWTWIASATPLQKKKMICSFLYYVQVLIIGWAGQWTRIPSATSLQPKKWNVNFWITFNFWWFAGLVNGLESHLQLLSNQKDKSLIFWLHSTSDDWPGWSMDADPICYPSPAKKMKCLFLDYVQLLMIGQAGQWTLTPSTIPLQPRNEMLIFGLLSISGDQPGWSMDSNPIQHPSPAKKIKCLFLDYFQFWVISQAGQWTQTPSAIHLQPKKWNACFWIMWNFWWLARLVDGLKPHPPPVSSQKNEMLIFGLLSILGDQPGWSMDSNPICNPSPTKKMKCLFLDYVKLLMIGQVGWWTQTPSTTRLQPKKWNACFWIMFNFWWLARLVDGLKPHPPPVSSQKNDMLIFVLRSTSDDWPGWSMDSNPICNLSPTKNMKCLFLDYVQLLVISQAGQRTWSPSATSFQPTKWNAHFGIMFNFWRSAGLVDGLKPHLSPLSNQKNEMLVFGLCSTSDDQLCWSMDSNPICHPFQGKKIKCSFLDYIQLLMIGQVGRWTWTPSATPLEPKKWNACFCITFNFWWLAGLVDGLEQHPLPFSSQKMKCSFLDYIQLLMIGQAGHWTRTPSTSPLQPKKMKCSFLDYV